MIKNAINSFNRSIHGTSENLVSEKEEIKNKSITKQYKNVKSCYKRKYKITKF